MKKINLVTTLLLSCFLNNLHAQTVPYGRCDTFTLHRASLVAYYNFSTASGPVTDLSGKGHTGTRVGAVANIADAGGNPDCAMQFPGLANNHIRISSDPDFDFATHPATISVWYLAQETNGGKYEQLLGRGPGFKGDYSVALHDCRRPVAMINSAFCWDSLTIASPCDTSSFYRMQWNHLVVVFDNGGSGAARPATVYLNGVASNDWHSGSGPMGVDTGNVYLGDNFKGLMDDVRIYSTAFTAADVNALYTYGIAGCCNTATSLREQTPGKNINIYPNPAGDRINIEAPQEFSGGSITVFNALGQAVLHTSLSNSLNLEQLPAGVYILDCSNMSGDTHIRQRLNKL
ncbi:MAG: T9SS type A sorting domain-containing protein [Chitinophagaceae bacterium]|nr:T9SS type A sorting domain-containing protein [Chitinophagaceae bacterium]